MEETKDSVLVLSASASGEKDKLIEAFGLHRGLFTAKVKGVKTEKAKLKFLAQPFCFADVVLFKQSGFYLVKTADLQESFFSLTQDLETYYMGCLVLEVLKTFSLKEVAHPAIFLAALKTLKILAYDAAVNKKVAVICFLLHVFKTAGYGFTLNKCASCGSLVPTKTYFDTTSGSLVCLSCRTIDCIEITPQVLKNMQLLTELHFDRLHTLKVQDEVANSILKLLKQAYLIRFGKILKSI